MKAKVLTSILAVILLFSLTSVHAENSKTKVYSNTEYYESGCKKEYTFIDKESSKAVKKIASQYDSSGLLKEKTVYLWSNSEGWTSVQKYDYEYNNDNKMATLIYTEWDQKLSAWSPKSQHLIHIYNTNGELLTVKQFEVNSNTDNLFAEK